MLDLELNRAVPLEHEAALLPSLMLDAGDRQCVQTQVPMQCRDRRDFDGRVLALGVQASAGRGLEG
jgi:hypothetical protein